MKAIFDAELKVSCKFFIYSVLISDFYVKIVKNGGIKKSVRVNCPSQVINKKFFDSSGSFMKTSAISVCNNQTEHAKNRNNKPYYLLIILLIWSLN